MSIKITKKTSTVNTTASKGRAISYIVIHYTAGTTSKAGSAANTAAWFANASAKASADFIVDDGTIVQFNPDIANRYCWHCGGSKYNTKGGSLYGVAKNSNSIGVEICSTNDTGKVTDANDSHWSYTDAVLNKAVELVKYLMEKYGIDVDHVIRHYDVNGKPCPGIIGWNADTGSEAKWQAFKARLTGSDTTATTTGTQATEFANLTEAQVVAKVGPLFTANQKSSGILASVSLAQFILESGYGKTELAQNANNCFGMKKSLSGNTWAGSTWDGVSVYTKKTQEQKADGSEYTITADFRKYPNVEDSIADHSAYLLGAKNGSALRYAGIAGMTDYKAVAQLIKDGGYATDVSYVSKLCNIIEKWNLTQYDADSSGGTSTGTTVSVSDLPAVPFMVKVLISDLNYRSSGSMSGAVKGQTGKGTFTITEINSAGWGKLKSGAGWIYLLNTSYCTIGKTVSDSSTSTGVSAVPYMVKVSIPNLNIRSGPGTNYVKTGKFTGVGTFTIVEESSGAGSDKGWGKLKSGAGWISLAYCSKV